MKRSQIYSLLLLLLFCCLFIEVQPWRTKLTGKRKEASEDVLPIKITNDKDIIWQRGDTPPSFYLPTLTGTFTFTPLASGEQNPIVFYAFNQQSTFQVAMWDHDTYLSTLFKKSENTTQYVFLNYNETNTIQVASYMASRCEYILGSLGFTPASITQWNSRLHFVTVPVSQLTSGDNFIPSLLSQWVSSLTYLNVTYPSTSEQKAPRLDGRWPWTPSMTSVFNSTTFNTLAWFGEGCVNLTSSLPGPQNVTGSIALIAANGLRCSFAEKIIAAEEAGAIGAIVYQSENENLIDMTGFLYPDIPSTMISYQDSAAITNYLLSTPPPSVPLKVEFYNNYTSGFWFAIDSNSQLQECGYIMYPSFDFIAYMSQFLTFQQNVTQSLNSISNSSISVTIFDQVQMNGPISSTVSFPITPSQMQQYGKLEIDAQLNCPGKNDDTCPMWDRTLQLLVCCNSSSILCNQEIGRWITPFKRGAGHWISDITPLIPLLDQQQCNFQFAINQSGGGVDDPWRPSAKLVFSQLNTGDSIPVGPTSIIPLFNGGTFDNTYNQAYQPVSFQLPANTQKVVLSAIITGHGCGDDCCCEFCPTTHNFVFMTTNATSTITKTFENAGTLMGCAERVRNGVEPNEYGTWLYGRDGWCDGENVFPWVTDVTNLVLPGITNQVDYFAQFQGQDPSQGGYIIMYSYLTFFTVL